MVELDRAGPVRRGEELDAAAVHAWLAARVPELAAEPAPPRVTQYSGGASNWTYRLEYEKADLVLRRPPAGTKAKSAHDVGREFRVQRALRPVFPLVPEMVALCEDASVLGVPFCVMRRVEGEIPRKSFNGVDAAQARALCERFVDTLAALHRVDVQKTGLASLGRGPGYVRRQVDGWSDRYRKARTWNVPSFGRVTRWLDANAPPDDAGACLIHNDFRLDNVVLDPADPTRIVCVLDWEMATIGDPLMDLGSALAYWTQADDGRFALRVRRQPTHLPGMMTRREVVARYFEARGLAPRDTTFHEVFGLFRLAVIVQQIYYRYHHRQTRNPAFRDFWLLAHWLNARCLRRIREASRTPT